MKTAILGAVVFAIACVVAGVIILNRPATPDTTMAAATADQKVEPAPSAKASQLAAPPEQARSPGAEVTPPAPPSPATPSASPAGSSKAAANAPNGVASVTQPNGSGKEPLQDPLARVALAFVGADPIAEEYWFAAINDPSLPAQERQDLIEDLNEDGLSDPKHPGREDLPLILNRLVLIEKVAPTAPDQVNADALQETYKDLVNLARLVLGGGEPVR